MKTLKPQIIKTVDATTLKEWLDQDQVTLIDVREPAEYAGEHLPNAMLVPLSQFASEKINIAKGQDAENKKLVLYCRTSNRSAQAAQKLLASGFESVIHLAGGMDEWKQKGFPTVINQKAPISLMRQVQIVAGSLVVTGTLLGAFVSPWFLLLSGFVGSGLLFAGITNTCALAMLLAKLPYNQKL